MVCATCSKPVERVSVYQSDGDPWQLRVLFECHGAREQASVTLQMMVHDYYRQNLISYVPKRAFMRNWARYSTTTRPERRPVVQGFQAKVR